MLAADERSWDAGRPAQAARLGGGPGKDRSRSAARQWETALLPLARLKTPPDRKWLAYVETRERAAWRRRGRLDGVGQVEDVFVEPGFATGDQPRR